MNREKLLTPDEIIRTGVRLTNGWPFSYAEISQLQTSESLVLHRSIYRDYFSLAMRGLSNPENRLSDEMFDNFFDRFAHRFMSREWDFVNLVPLNRMAKKSGWINPFGWDSDTDKIIRPLTKLFNNSASVSALLENFHHRAVSGSVELTGYEHFVVQYVEDALKASPSNPPVYDAIIQTQAQVAEYAIRIRKEFEDSQGRPMLRADWEVLKPDLYKVVMRKAAGSRVDSFLCGLAVAYGAQPFIFTDAGNGQLRLAELPMDEAATINAAAHLGHGDFIEHYGSNPVTGCPALYSKLGDGMGLVKFVTETFLGAVANDFWPIEKVVPVSVAQCPFHSHNE